MGSYRRLQLRVGALGMLAGMACGEGLASTSLESIPDPSASDAGQPAPPPADSGSAAADGGAGAGGGVDAAAGVEPSIAPMMGIPGELLLYDDFDDATSGAFAPTPDVSWHGNGTWTWEMGALRVVDDPTISHCPGITRVIACHDVIGQVSFKLESSAIHVNFNSPDPTTHVLKMVVTAAAMRLYKTGGYGPTSTEVLLNEVPVQLQQDHWYTLLFEVVGDELSLELDTGELVYGQATGIDVDKSQISMNMCGTEAWFDSFRMWDAAPDPGWPARKQTLESDAGAP